MKAIPWITPAILVCASLFAQPSVPKPEFEVASITPSGEIVAGSPQQVNIGIKIDGAQFHSTSFALKDYIRIAWRVKDYQVEGPDWIASERFNISAKIPAGASRDTVPEMLQSLLEQRFGLKFHREKKDFPVYGLVVTHKERLKESPPDAAGGADAAAAPVDVSATGGRGGVNVNYGHGSYVSFADNKFEAKKLPMAYLAEWLGRFLDRPVVDMTGLPGVYDYKLEITPEDYRAMLIRSALAAGVAMPPEAMRLLEGATDDSLFSALQAYGLKIEPRKAPLDVIAIDHIDKAPTAN